MVPDHVQDLHVGVSVPTHVPFMPLPINCMNLEVNMISVVTGGADYVVFNVIVDSGCSSHTFNCLTYIDNYKVMIEEDHSSMVLADRVMSTMFRRSEIVCCRFDRWTVRGLRPRSVMGYVRCGTEQQGRSSYIVAYRRRMACIRCLKSNSRSS